MDGKSTAVDEISTALNQSKSYKLVGGILETKEMGTATSTPAAGGLPYNIPINKQLRLNIVKGAIEEQNVDVIVCPTYQFPGLSGVVARTMESAGGQQFIQACSQLGSLEFGQLKRSSGGGRLKCKHVYLTKIETRWSKGSAQQLYDIVKESLEEASKYKQQTIAFPTFGTGKSMYPANELAETMIESVSTFARENPNTTLTDVYIVVYDKDLATTDIFEKCVPQMLTVPKGKLPYSKYFSQTFRLNVVMGAIEEQDVDVVVCPTYKFPGLSGGIGRKLESMGGQQFIQACKQLGTLEFGEMKRTSGGGRLRCKNVYLTKLKNRWSIGSWQRLYDIVKESLEEASKYNQKTIAFPTFGTGDSSYPADEVVVAMIKSVIHFASTNPNTTLTDAFIVVYTKDTETQYIIETRVPQKMAGQSDTKVPDDWEIFISGKQYEEVELDPDDKTFKEVKTKFIIGKCPFTKIERILRIENRYLWIQYHGRKLQLEAQNNPHDQNERELWHGTDEITAKQILHHGYNRSFAGKNANSYGRGTYFAVNSRYSGQDLYARPDSNGVSRMILNKVLVGYYTQVRKNDAVLPPRIQTPQGDIPYDSAVNDTQNIVMFIVFHDSQAYPQYVIEYRSASRNEGSS